MVKASKVYKYSEIAQILGKKESKNLCYKTIAHKLDNGNISIKLYNTDIIQITPENKYILFAGSWQTAITKDRINGFSPATIKQVKGKWLVKVDQCGLTGWMPFSDNMIVDEWGAPISPNPFESVLSNVLLVG